MTITTIDKIIATDDSMICRISINMILLTRANNFATIKSRGVGVFPLPKFLAVK